MNTKNEINCDGNKERIEWIDIARALLIIIVVFEHSLRLGHTAEFLQSFSIPAFFILSGITFKKKEFKIDFINRFKKILIPYYIFGFISIIIYFIIGTKISNYVNAQISSTSLIPNFFGLLYANWRTGYMQWNTSLYYLPLFFTTGILVNVLENKIDNWNNKKYIRIGYVIIMLFISYFINLNKNYICLPYGLEVALFCSSLMEIGILFKDILLKKYNSINLLLCSLTVFILCYPIAIHNTPYGFNNFNLGSNYIIFVILCIIMSIALFLFSKFIKSCYILNLIGRNTIGIMCMHKFPVLFFTSFIPYFNNNIVVSLSNTLERHFSASIITIISIVLCLACIYVIMLIYPQILGEGKKRNIFEVKGKNE